VASPFLSSSQAIAKDLKNRQLGLIFLPWSAPPITAGEQEF
jgi:hypothetical protein